MDIVLHVETVIKLTNYCRTTSRTWRWRAKGDLLNGFLSVALSQSKQISFMQASLAGPPARNWKCKYCLELQWMKNTLWAETFICIAYISMQIVSRRLSSRDPEHDRRTNMIISNIIITKVIILNTNQRKMASKKKKKTPTVGEKNL